MCPANRERVGLGIDGSNSAAAVRSIVAAEDAGVRQIWMAQLPIWPDTLTTLAADAEKTSTINLGTSIIPTYPRHLSCCCSSISRFSIVCALT
jgi:alkanesulfonate monooxygenase SsuD/methylene tetrahydromethanopterin reductase-like flavin-dependent oxidoreductase (luciferase family)